MSYDLYNALIAYGDQYPLQISVNCNEILSELRFFESDWTQYNPRKLPNNRVALSITNSNGILGAGPDLDSLPEYNSEHGTYLDEQDFVVPTPVYDIFAECFDPFSEWLFRRTRFLPCQFCESLILAKESQHLKHAIPRSYNR